MSTKSAEPSWLRDVLTLRARKGMNHGRLMLEGLRLNAAAHGAGAPFEQLIYAPEFFSEDRCRELVLRLERDGVPSRRVQPETFSRLSYKADGVLGVVRYVPPTIDEVLAASTIVILDALSDPGNIGAVLRTANAWGRDARTGVVVVDGADKLYHPKALRASMGAVFHTPTCAAERATAVAKVVTSKKPVVVLTPEGASPCAARSVSLEVLALEPEVVIVLGNERRGVHPLWLGVATSRVHIPTRGVVDSLNVATAAAIVLWEAFRAPR